MNERIRELIEQAVIAVDNPFPGNPLNDELEKMYIPDCFAEKFAELIVKECMNVARQQRNPANLNYKPSERFVEDLRQHFGVEE